MTKPHTGWVSHTEVQDKSAHTGIVEKQGADQSKKPGISVFKEK